MPDYGMKVSRSGADAGTADVLNLVFSSKYDSLKIFSNGSNNATVPAYVPPTGVGSTTVTVSHNLGYYPLFIVFSSNPHAGTANLNRLSPYGFRSVGVVTPSGFQWSCGTDNIYLTFYNNFSTVSATVPYRYQIYYNKIK